MNLAANPVADLQQYSSPEQMVPATTNAESKRFKRNMIVFRQSITNSILISTAARSRQLQREPLRQPRLWEHERSSSRSQSALPAKVIKTVLLLEL